MSIDLSKVTPITTDRLYVGVDWEGVKASQQIKIGGLSFGSKAKKQKAVDLDLTIVVLNADGQPITYCDGDETPVFGGALSHTGNSRDGKGEGDDEAATAVLSNIPSAAHTLLYALTAFDASNFGAVSRVSYTVKDAGSGAVLVNEYLPIEPQYNAALMVKVSRNGSGWDISFYEGRAHLNVRTTPGDQQAWRALVTAAKNAGLV